jgi:hypothetical protein
MSRLYLLVEVKQKRRSQTIEIAEWMFGEQLESI